LEWEVAEDRIRRKRIEDLVGKKKFNWEFVGKWWANERPARKGAGAGGRVGDGPLKK